MGRTTSTRTVLGPGGVHVCGRRVLCDPRISTMVATSLKYFHDARVLTGDFIVMPNHVHVLMTPLPRFELEDILQAIKSYTGTQINKVLRLEGAFWQRESYDHIVRDWKQLEAFQRYIAANPEKAKLNSGEYILSTARYVPAC